MPLDLTPYLEPATTAVALEVQENLLPESAEWSPPFGAITDHWAR